MKRTRKGFTLIELLIVITILGSLAAAMSNSSGDATARAKAASIVANVEACKTAAAIYYNDHWDETGIKDVTAAEFLKEESTYIPNWADFAKEGNIQYTVDTTKYGANETKDGKGRDNWAIKVDFTNDAEAANVQKALAKMKGYSVVVTNTTVFYVNLTTGKIQYNDLAFYLQPTNTQQSPSRIRRGFVFAVYCYYLRKELKF